MIFHMIPAEKTPQVDGLLTTLTGKSRVTQIESSLCTTCNGKAVKFRDDLCKREYTISGMCQDCQDEVFGSEEED